MAMLHNLKVYLGLGPDEEYDDSYLDSGHDRPEQLHQEETDETRPRRTVDGYSGSAVRPTRISPSSDSDQEMLGAVRPIRPVRTAEKPSESTHGPRAERDAKPNGNSDLGLAVRPVRVGRSKPSTIEPDSFADAKLVADEFGRGTPVVINMVGLSNDLSRRLIDFASGVCYIEGGSMKKLARGVFLVTPKTAEVRDEELRRLEERGYRR